jgi:hypothetical protein
MEPGSRRSVKHEYIGDLFANAANNALLLQLLCHCTLVTGGTALRRWWGEINRLRQDCVLDCMQEATSTNDVIAMMCMRRKVYVALHCCMARVN